jgi:hypothetical protein
MAVGNAVPQLCARDGQWVPFAGKCIRLWSVEAHGQIERTLRSGKPVGLAENISHRVGLASSSASDPSCCSSSRYERDYGDISHVCRPISAMRSRKAEQEWHREEKDNDVT